MTSTPSKNQPPSAVFIASTPLQYINIREAVQQFDVVPRALVIPLINHERSVYEQLDPEGSWTETIFVPRRHPDFSKKLGWAGKAIRLAADWFFYRRLGNIARQLAPIHTLFVGFYDAYDHRHFANLLAPRRLIAVDDGAATISIHNRRRKGPAPLHRPLETLVRHSLLGVEFDEFRRVTHFTAYELDDHHDRVVRNNYSDFRARCSRSIRRNDDVWLLGQPTTVDSTMSLSAYVRCVRDVVDAYPEANAIRYIPHPRERRAAVDTLLDKTAVKLKKTDGPIEWELATATTWPRRLVGFRTSAIQTCRKIFDGELPTDVILPNPHVWTTNDLDTNALYEMYRNTTEPPHRFVEL